MKLSESLFKIAKSPLGDSIVGIAFGKLSNLIPIKKVFENEKVIAFYHPKPYWEIHILVVPKKAIRNLSSLTGDDTLYIVEIFNVIKRIVGELSLEEKGYSVITNGGSRQEVHQLHFHLFSGKEIK